MGQSQASPPHPVPPIPVTATCTQPSAVSSASTPAVLPTTPLILPCTGLLGIPPALVKRITEGKFIDLGDLLPEALDWAFERSTEDRKEDKGRVKKFPISTVTDWFLAFSIYMAVSINFDPSKAKPLAIYQSIVARLAREVPGQVWLRYDRLFRQAAAANPSLAWDHREPDIWLAATSEQSRVPLLSATPSRWQSQAPAEICRRFNRGDCFLASCKFWHACSVCQQGHPARECPMLRIPARRPPPREPRRQA